MQLVMDRSAIARPATKAAQRCRMPSRTSVRVCAHIKSPREQVASAVASFGLAASLIVGVPMAGASDMADAALEREYLIQQQKSALEYMLQQQENARKAQLLQQRKVVEAQVSSVESAIQQKITEQRANVIAAEKAGDKKLAESISAQEAQMEEKAAAVRKAAVDLETRLDRVEMLSKAKAASEKQQVEKAAQAANEDINAVLDKWLESVNNMKM